MDIRLFVLSQQEAANDTEFGRKVYTTDSSVIRIIIVFFFWLGNLFFSQFYCSPLQALTSCWMKALAMMYLEFVQSLY